MSGITTEDLVMRLRELLLEQKVAQQGSTVSRTTSDLWQTAAAAVTSDTSVMNGSSFLTARPPVAVGQNNTISQAILNVLQGIRPRHQNNSQSFQVK